MANSNMFSSIRKENLPDYLICYSALTMIISGFITALHVVPANNLFRLSLNHFLTSVYAGPLVLSVYIFSMLILFLALLSKLILFGLRVLKKKPVSVSVWAFHLLLLLTVSIVLDLCLFSLFSLTPFSVSLIFSLFGESPQQSVLFASDQLLIVRVYAMQFFLFPAALSVILYKMVKSRMFDMSFEHKNLVAGYGLFTAVLFFGSVAYLTVLKRVGLTFFLSDQQTRETLAILLRLSRGAVIVTFAVLILQLFLLYLTKRQTVQMESSKDRIDA
ncbi:hypothetical protein CHISP_0521 [Chitinispirillum alkaliphilum]|nr:hypothetical protein CHISP_0521 [Chitinispirillum alkaliphilum]